MGKPLPIYELVVVQFEFLEWRQVTVVALLDVSSGPEELAGDGVVVAVMAGQHDQMQWRVSGCVGGIGGCTGGEQLFDHAGNSALDRVVQGRPSGETQS